MINGVGVHLAPQNSNIAGTQQQYAALHTDILDGNL